MNMLKNFFLKSVQKVTEISLLHNQSVSSSNEYVPYRTER